MYEYYAENQYNKNKNGMSGLITFYQIFWYRFEDAGAVFRSLTNSREFF